MKQIALALVFALVIQQTAEAANWKHYAANTIRAVAFVTAPVHIAAWWYAGRLEKKAKK
ncbi:MAG: hypothetical protein KGL39_23255 [Patescibacteria group bacterium]|nr:hypothetical protein [Patescibacteria group bacterium]